MQTSFAKSDSRLKGKLLTSVAASEYFEDRLIDAKEAAELEDELAADLELEFSMYDDSHDKYWDYEFGYDYPDDDHEEPEYYDPYEYYDWDDY